jgi:hypothetical protein
MRFEILRSPILLPLLAAFGGVKSKSYLELREGALYCKFGFLFEELIPYDDIERVESEASWPWYGGVGWRTDLVGRIAIVGSLDNIVCIHLREGRKARLFFKLKLRELYVSLEEPEKFCSVLRERLS